MAGIAGSLYRLRHLVERTRSRTDLKIRVRQDRRRGLAVEVVVVVVRRATGGRITRCQSK
jgi:hypothetical protein